MTPFGSEIYDAKTENVRCRPKGPYVYCEKCKSWQGHEVTCSEVSVESIAMLLAQSRHNEQQIRDKAARWLESLQRLTGKLAVLKHENNKLRKANERLLAELEVYNEEDDKEQRT